GTKISKPEECNGDHDTRSQIGDARGTNVLRPASAMTPASGTRMATGRRLCVNLVHEGPAYASEFARHFRLSRSAAAALSAMHHPLLDEKTPFWALLTWTRRRRVVAEGEEIRPQRRFGLAALPPATCCCSIITYVTGVSRDLWQQGHVSAGWRCHNKPPSACPAAEESDSSSPGDSLRHWRRPPARVAPLPLGLAGLAESQARRLRQAVGRAAPAHQEDGLVNRLLLPALPPTIAPQVPALLPSKVPPPLMTMSPTRAPPLPPLLPRQWIIPTLHQLGSDTDDDDGEARAAEDNSGRLAAAASGNSPVLLVGEPGEGKSLRARQRRLPASPMAARTTAGSAASASGSVLLYHSPCPADYRSGATCAGCSIRLLAELLDGVDWAAAASAGGCRLRTQRLPADASAAAGASGPIRPPFCSDLLREDRPRLRLADAVAFLLEFSGPRRPLHLILPGCDQLRGDPGAARLLNWLPSNLARSLRARQDPAQPDNVGVSSGGGGNSGGDVGGGRIDCELVLPLFERERDASSLPQHICGCGGSQPPLSAAEVARLARCRSPTRAMFLQLSAARSRRRQCQRLPDCDSLSELCRSVVADAVEESRPNSTLAMEIRSRRPAEQRPADRAWRPFFAEKDGVEARRRRPGSAAGLASGADRIDSPAYRRSWSPRLWAGVLGALAPFSLQQPSAQFWLSRAGRSGSSGRSSRAWTGPWTSSRPPLWPAVLRGRLEDFLCRWDRPLLRAVAGRRQCGDYSSMAERYCALLEAAEAACRPARPASAGPLLLIWGAAAGRDYYRKCLEAAKSAYKLAKAAGLPQPITADLCGLMFHLYDDRLKLSDFRPEADAAPGHQNSPRLPSASTPGCAGTAGAAGSPLLQMRLSFALDSWRACSGGHSWLTLPSRPSGWSPSSKLGLAAGQRGRHDAGVLAKRGSDRSCGCTRRPLRLARKIAVRRLPQAGGADCTSNIGIAYEDK
uniref:AAA_5 domain-containing protein n=1 Tax=Macrostomum lignano TaxID=282301 RepID=A0A1I8FC42_9PLAT